MPSPCIPGLSTLSIAAAMLPAPVIAHPHVFVDTGLRIVVNAEGLLTGIEVTWAYDELYSMLIVEDKGLDHDHDGHLTPAELETLNGFDMNWIEGFEGDLYVTGSNGPVTLGPPQAGSIAEEDTRLTTVHSRSVTPVPADGLVIKAYDPTFYTAYDLTRGVTVDGPCRIELTEPDIDAAYRKVDEMMQNLADDAFPEVGESFADQLRLICES